MWFWLSAAAMAATAAIHSWAGERKIVRPVLDAPNSPLTDPQSRKVMRSAWHLTSGFMILCAVVVVWPDTPSGAVLSVGGFWLVLGLFSLTASRGRHVGWPTLCASGILAILGVYA
ncbi:MAG: hypothetical protein ABJ205_07990 [Erythrobacter sp.]|uniref:hypothetical protein n=1 Tax=Erythrobacter sp. TaxID=1042 RepID=UPI00326336A5